MNCQSVRSRYLKTKGAVNNKKIQNKFGLRQAEIAVEVPTGIEPVYAVLQTAA